MAEQVRRCDNCGAPIPLGSSPRRRYCSRVCKNAANYNRADRTMIGAPTATVGAAHELLVCVDLMRRGYHVFRAVSPSSPCDLVVFRGDEKPLRIEVRTAARSVGGKIYIPADKGTERYDVKAWVFHDGDIMYVPENALAGPLRVSE